MTNEYNIYIDETCHLEHDGIPVMCIGSIKLPKEKYNRRDGWRATRERQGHGCTKQPAHRGGPLLKVHLFEHCNGLFRCAWRVDCCFVPV